MYRRIVKILHGKKILILGFGREGISSYKFIRKILPEISITIADKDKNVLNNIDFILDDNCQTILGKSYISNPENFDLILKTPGIPNNLLKDKVSQNKITSQTDLFLQLFSSNTIGVTGTKGKSTTSSLIRHILSYYHKDVVLIGNIGVPPFDMIEKIGKETRVVFEMSSYQLENISVSPHIAVILNLFQEHLDHYENFDGYQSAKFNITKFQSKNDWVIFNADNPSVNKLIAKSGFTGESLEFSSEKEISTGAFLNREGNVVFKQNENISEFDFNNRLYLPGRHNLMNIMAAVCACKLLEISDNIISEAISGFKGLEHRLEYIGKYGNIHFYNDSIATIPEAAIEAVKTLKTVDTLILGGKDRGIDYSKLAKFISQSDITNLIFTGEAGKRILEEVEAIGISNKKKYFLITRFDEIKQIIKQYTKPGYICLLSPAASSYDMFKNFEERGEAFKKIAGNI